MKTLVAGIQAALFTCAIHPAANAQDTLPLAALSEFGYQTLIEGAPSRSGFPRDCPAVRKRVPGQPWNEWTSDNLPEGCRDTPPITERAAARSRFELRTYFDIGTVGWDNNYNAMIPSLGGFHVSFASVGGWKLGAGGLLASFSPVFDLQTQTRQYEISPRLNLFNVNRKIREFASTSYDLYVTIAGTREMFMPAARTLDGSEGFNNVFFGFAVSPRAK